MIKIYNRNHFILDEIVKYADLSYSWTLNGYGQGQFSIGLESDKATPENLEFGNRVEFWKDGVLQWGGIIVKRSFNGATIDVSCYGYLYLLKMRRLSAKQYATMTYGNLIRTMLEETNTATNTGIAVGDIAVGALETTRKVESTDYVLEKMLDFVGDGNYNIDVDNDRNLNFYLRKGKLQSNFILEYGGLNDNIVTDPGLDISMLDMANSVYSEIEKDGVKMTTLAQDSASQAKYGLIEGTYSANNSIVYQSTLDSYAAAELQRRAYPMQSMKVSIRDSGLCPFGEFEVGDTIPLNLIPYWGFNANVRILEIKHNEDTGIRDLTIGNVIYRPAKPEKKLYKG